MYKISGSDIGEGGVAYRFKHDVKAGLILRCAHMGFCCLIDAFMFQFNENRAARKLNSTFPKSESSCLEMSSEAVQHDF